MHFPRFSVATLIRSCESGPVEVSAPVSMLPPNVKATAKRKSPTRSTGASWAHSVTQAGHGRQTKPEDGEREKKRRKFSAFLTGRDNHPHDPQAWSNARLRGGMRSSAWLRTLEVASFTGALQNPCEQAKKCYKRKEALLALAAVTSFTPRHRVVGTLSPPSWSYRPG